MTPGLNWAAIGVGLSAAVVAGGGIWHVSAELGDMHASIEVFDERMKGAMELVDHRLVSIEEKINEQFRRRGGD